MSSSGEPPPSPGNGKSIAAIAAGAASTILIYVANTAMKHYGGDPLPQEIVAAVQTLLTAGAVYFTPHGSS